MDIPVKLSHTSALILQTISHGYRYGFDIMDVTGLPSGTVVTHVYERAYLRSDRVSHVGRRLVAKNVKFVLTAVPTPFYFLRAFFVATVAFSQSC